MPQGVREEGAWDDLRDDRGARVPALEEQRGEGILR